MRVLVLSAHPDDETLGMGGTMLAHGAAGDSVHWLVATRAHEPIWSAETIARKADEVERVAAAYGVATLDRLDFPTAQLDTVALADLVAGVRQAVDRDRPHTVYVTHPGDVHTDHARLFDATVAALRAFRAGREGVRRILCYETLSSTDAAPPQRSPRFTPNVYRDVTPYLERKLEIMAHYASEEQADPLPRGASAIRALGRYRGATVGVDYAEAFELVREVIA